MWALCDYKLMEMIIIIIIIIIFITTAIEGYGCLLEPTPAFGCNSGVHLTQVACPSNFFL